MALRWRQYKAHVNMLSNYVPGQFVDSLTSFSFKYVTVTTVTIGLRINHFQNQKQDKK